MLPAGVRIGSVRLYVADLARCVQFYHQAIGLHERSAVDGVVALGTPTETLLVLVERPGGRFVRGTTGLYHMALRVPARADLAHWLIHYAEQSPLYWQGASDHGVSAALYLADPEGNGIEIYHDTPPETWSYQDDGTLALIARPLDLQRLMAEAPARPWQQLPDATDMGHVHLRVQDIGPAELFYSWTLGFAVRSRFERSALFVAAGGYHHHIGLNTWQSAGAEPPPPDAYGLAEVSILMPDTATQAELVARLVAADYPHTLVAGDCLADDPAGIRLRFTVAAPAGLAAHHAGDQGRS